MILSGKTRSLIGRYTVVILHTDIKEERTLEDQLGNLTI